MTLAGLHKDRPLDGVARLRATDAPDRRMVDLVVDRAWSTRIEGGRRLYAAPSDGRQLGVGFDRAVVIGDGTLIRRR